MGLFIQGTIYGISQLVMVNDTLISTRHLEQKRDTGRRLLSVNSLCWFGAEILKIQSQ